MKGRRLLHGLLLALGCAIGWGQGCSALIDPREKELLCTVSAAGTPEVCPQGLQCRDGRCQAPCDRTVPDKCKNNIDDDCDGTVDEVDKEGRDTCGDLQDNDCDGRTDEGSDLDQDTYSWCGRTLDSDGGGSAGRDCDDTLLSVHPGAREICDGRDNDCNGLIDEINANAPLCDPGSVCFNQRCIVPSCVNEGPAQTCLPTERCDAATGMCVSKKCADVTCAANEYCDEATKTCVKKQPLDNGAPCIVGADCASGSCIDAAALRLASSGRVCGTACCNDTQCDPDERCFASGTGARSCLPVALLPKMAERECTTEPACAANERCALSNDKALSPPTFIAREKVITSTCQPDMPALRQPGDRCFIYTECSARACVPGLIGGSVCSAACGELKDCMGVGAGAYCRFVDVTLAADAPVDYAPICVIPRPGELSNGQFGEPCSKATDCREAGCVGATNTTMGRCTPACCSDKQCGNREDGVQIRCRPYAFGTRYEMRCDI